LLRALGCEVTELYLRVDGNFLTIIPTRARWTTCGISLPLKSGHADVGLAFDGDGDRLGVVAPDGSIIWPDRVLMLFAMDLLERNPGGQIITTSNAHGSSTASSGNMVEIR
jgi:phosphomannomutase